MRHTEMEKGGTNIEVKSVDIEAMKRKGWTVVITSTDKPRKKRKKKSIDKVKPLIEDSENGNA